MDNSSTFNWTTKNLDVDKFRNGDLISEARTDEEWELAGLNGTPAWCYYKNDSKYGLVSGKLYNFFAVCDERCLAPDGYHIATDNEWLELIRSVGVDACDKLRSKNGWGLRKGTDIIGFSALPSGFREGDGSFSVFINTSYFWSATEKFIKDNNNFAWYYILSSFNDNVDMNYTNKSSGGSVRCLRD